LLGDNAFGILVKTLSFWELQGISSSQLKTTIRASHFLLERIISLVTLLISKRSLLVLKNSSKIVTWSAESIRGATTSKSWILSQQIISFTHMRSGLFCPFFLDIILNIWSPMCSWSINREFHVESLVCLTTLKSWFWLESKVELRSFPTGTVWLTIIQAQCTLDSFGLSDFLGNRVDLIS